MDLVIGFMRKNRIRDAWHVLLGRAEVEARRVMVFRRETIKAPDYYKMSCVVDVPVLHLDALEQVGSPIELPGPDGSVWRLWIEK